MIANHYLWIFRLTNYSMSRKKLRKEGGEREGERKGKKEERGKKWCFCFKYTFTIVAVSLLSRVQLFLWPHGAKPDRLFYPWDFPSQEYWSGLPFPSPGGSSQPRDQITSPALADGFFTAEPPGNPPPPPQMCTNYSPFVGKVMSLLFLFLFFFIYLFLSLLFNMLSRLVIAFLPRSKHLNFRASVTICSDFWSPPK